MARKRRQATTNVVVCTKLRRGEFEALRDLARRRNTTVYATVQRAVLDEVRTDVLRRSGVEPAVAR